MSMRLDKAILETHPDFSRSRIEGLVKAGYVTVNGVVAGKAGLKISEDDEIVVEIPPPVPAVPEPEDIPLDVVFEDDDIVVVNKPAGLVVHPAPGHFTGTLVNALLHHCPKLSGIGGVARPGIVHRLDQDTSGLIIVAKTQPAMDGLVKAFSSHRNIEKTYLAVCHPAPQGSLGYGLSAGRIENLIGRHPVDRKRMAIVEKNGKLAITNWRLFDCSDCSDCSIQTFKTGRSHKTNPPISQFSDQTIKQSNSRTIEQSNNQAISWVECRIETGRTHQIRVHMASLGRPVIGDKVYGKSALDNRLDPVPLRQMLHAWRLKLWHPVRSVEMAFEAPIPADMRAYVPQGEKF